MSEIKVVLEDNILKIEQIRKRQSVYDKLSFDIRTLVYDRKYRSDIEVKSKKNLYRILFAMPYHGSQSAGNEEMDMGEDHIVVWSDGLNLKYGYLKLSKVYADFFEYRHKVLTMHLSKKYLYIVMAGYFIQLSDDVKADEVKVYIDEYNQIDANMMVSRKVLSQIQMLNKKCVHCYKIPLAGLFRDETKINNLIKMIIVANGQLVDFRLTKKDLFLPSIRMYYAPYRSVYTKGYAVHVRRTERANFSIVKRPMEDIEKKLSFRIKESKLVSYILYHLGKRRAKKSKIKVNLFYEKNAAKAEEGTYELFLMSKKSKKSKSYFIIDEHSPDYERIKNEPGVVKKFSWKYYWLIYRVNAYISTEAPAHLNILRSNNRYFRITTCERPFVFLQHGVTYLKKQGESSTFVAGKEGEPKYMVVGSEKERDVCADMLKMPEDRFLNTGLPIFSRIEYNHITQDSPDTVVVMLTWKNYEEQIEEFEQSEYYRNVMDIYGALKKHIPESQILIVPHPKMLEHCKGTSMDDMMWHGPISQVFEKAKLLITDYSSACYNCFYQGAAVMFYQPDLAQYESEVGKLIPTDEEYIGPRLYSVDALKEALEDIFEDGKIILSKGRNETYEKNYAEINEFNDGKNIERIYEALVQKKLV